MRGLMNFKLKTAAAAMLAVALVASTALYASEGDKDPSAPAKKHAKTAAKKEACDACDQIQALKQEDADARSTP